MVGQRLSRVLVLLGMLWLLAGGGCSAMRPASTATPTTAPLRGELLFAGSTSMQPLVAELSAKFEVRYHGVDLQVGAGGSETGIQAVREGQVDIGMVSRELTSAEAEGLQVHRVAIDVIAVIVHPSNPVKELTLEQLRGIYSGRIRNWQELGGPDQEIALVVREVSSGTRSAFDNMVLDGEQLAPRVQLAATNGDVVALVRQRAAAIGYVGFGYLEDGVSPVTIDGAAPTIDLVREGLYPLTRPLLLLTGPLSQPTARVFTDFSLSAEGQQIVLDSGWVPCQTPQ